jgi:hypothetical protein
MTLGCSPLQSAHRTLCHDFSQFPPTTDAKQSCKTYRNWAMYEWATVQSALPEPASASYRRGFVDGFVDAVYAGGSGEPPIVPPRRFWRVVFRNDAGDAELTEWSRGFRHGARVALDNGYRRRAVVPTTQE